MEATLVRWVVVLDVACIRRPVRTKDLLHLGIHLMALCLASRRDGPRLDRSRSLVCQESRKFPSTSRVTVFQDHVQVICECFPVRPTGFLAGFDHLTIRSENGTIDFEHERVR